MARTRGSLAIASSLFVCLPLIACGSHQFRPEPSISFTKIPRYGVGSPVELNAIEGRVTGSHPGEKVLLYARSGEWWIQPLADKPFTEVQADSAWRNLTHPGSAYAALLVDANYRPRLRTDALPGKGNGVLAVAAVEGAEPVRYASGKRLQFGGYEWVVRDGETDPGGTPNYYDPANAWTDSKGFLHLRIAGTPSHWTSAEVILTRSLGYGSYRLVLRDVSHLEPSAVFTMMTWSDNGPAGEMDIEISKWGEKSARNGQFVIQPYHFPANTVQFQAPSGPTTFMLRWSAGRAWFKAFRGATAHWDDDAVREHVFTAGVPSSLSELVHLNFYVFDRTSIPLRHGSEVVVEAFEYLP